MSGSDSITRRVTICPLRDVHLSAYPLESHGMPWLCPLTACCIQLTACRIRLLSCNLLYIRYSKFLKCLVLDMEYTRGHQVRSHGHWGIVLWRLTEWSCVYYHHRLYSYYVHNILDTNKIQYHSNIHRCLVAFNILILSGLASGNTTQPGVVKSEFARR